MKGKLLLLSAALLVLALTGVMVQAFGGSANRVDLERALRPPSSYAWLGTDNLGRSLAPRILVGVANSLQIVGAALILATMLGTLIGSLAGYFFESWLDHGLQLLMNVIWSIPFLFLMIAVIASVGPGRYQLLLSLGLVSWVPMARLVRGRVSVLSNQAFVDSARALGYSTARIIFGHILPNITDSIRVMALFTAIDLLAAEAGLSFLGLGIPPPEPSLGQMIFSGLSLYRTAWWVLVFPTLTVAILFWVLGTSVGVAGPDARRLQQ